MGTITALEEQWQLSSMEDRETFLLHLVHQMPENFITKIMKQWEEQIELLKDAPKGQLVTPFEAFEGVTQFLERTIFLRINMYT